MVKITVSSVLTLLATAGSLVSGATLTKVNNFGANPTNAEMFIYVPDNVVPNPAILTVIHWCTGTANAIYSGTQYKTYADQYGFIVVYPDAPDAGGCWDVHSSGTLTHNGGGDSLAIANMVRHTISTYNADASRVYAVGVSSGGMMTQVLLGAYPDIFAAGSSWAGVPFSCFSGPDMWNSQCSQGQISKTGAQWGDLARAAYPGYTGKRPRVQLWHGTLDDVLYFQNFNEAIKQWTNVLGVSETPSATTTNFLGLGWTKYQYGPNIEAIKAEGVTHNVPHQDAEVLKFFGLLGTPAPTTTTRPPTSTPTSTKTTSTTATPTSTSGPVSQKWGQCGGISWTGPTRCVSGTTCTVINPYYYQCL